MNFLATYTIGARPLALSKNGIVTLKLTNISDQNDAFNYQRLKSMQDIWKRAKGSICLGHAIMTDQVRHYFWKLEERKQQERRRTLRVSRVLWTCLFRCHPCKKYANMEEVSVPLISVRQMKARDQLDDALFYPIVIVRHSVTFSLQVYRFAFVNNCFN